MTKSPHYPLLIPGVKATASSLEVKSPYHEKLIATVETAHEEAIEKALQNAHELFQDPKRLLPISKRIQILEKTIPLIEARAEELALMAALEGGKPLTDSQIEISRAIEGIKSALATLRTSAGEVIPMQLNQASAGRIAFTKLEPIGVVVAISAFNHPFNLIVHQVVPAIAVGCPILIKPASETPISCINFVKILYEAGLPPEWCQVVVTNQTDLAEKMATDSRVKFLSFIGSSKVGWMLRSKLSPGTRCALEHGGIAPVIVAEDADLQEAVSLIVKGGFYHAGQVCVSVQRVFVHESIAEKFAKKLAEKADQLRVGDPTEFQTEVGPLIRKSELERIDQAVQEAINAGAECLSGGKKISESCYACTVLYHPPRTASVMTEEIFGPVVSVVPYESIEEAIEWANESPFHFQAALFTQNLEIAMKVYSQIRASAVMINDHIAFRVDWMPFAGLDQSGLGVGGIPYTMREMQIEKMMVIRSKEI